MIHGSRTTHLTTIASCVLLMACQQPPDPAQLEAVDQLITATDGALLTLNELDRGRYRRSDSLFALQRGSMEMHFHDTLFPGPARSLGDQYVALRASARMGSDHERVLSDIGLASERLRNLRADIANGALGKEQAAPIITSEQQRHTVLVGTVHNVIDNYRTLQQAWDRRDTVTLLLSEANPITAP